ncbi:MAG: alpha/beta hydrolase [Candidatus Binatia bacterium]
MTFHVGERLALVGDVYGDAAAPPVLLLHGGGQTRHAWGETAAHLGACGFRAYALDQRGHGDSDFAPDADYRLEAFAADLRGVVVQLGARPAIVGASLGGLAALLAEGESAGTAGIASAIVLVDIVPRMELAGVARIVEFMRARPEGFASLEEAAEAVASFLPHRPRPTGLAGLRKNLRLGADGRYRWHWDRQMMFGPQRLGASGHADHLERCARTLRVPTLLVRGRMSDVVSEEGARRFLDLVPHARYADVSGAGHMVVGDRNDAFTQAVVTFLSEVVAR